MSARLEANARTLAEKGLSIASPPDVRGYARLRCTRCGCEYRIQLGDYMSLPSDWIGCPDCSLDGAWPGWRSIGSVAQNVVENLRLNLPDGREHDRNIAAGEGASNADSGLTSNAYEGGEGL